MRILLITDEIWNDRVFGNNVLQNWFEGMPNVEIAQICATPGRPFNTVCTRYFQLTDSMMLRSFFGPKAGRAFTTSIETMAQKPQTRNYIAESKFYTFMKKISGPPVKLARELLWNIGRLDRKALDKFVSNFNPDVVFCPRLLTWKLMRLEKAVAKITRAPFIAFTGDDEASFKEYCFDPLFWLNRFAFHKALAKHSKLYSHYFMHSADQVEEYRKDYGVSASTLFKSGSFPEQFSPKPIGEPIRMVYAGRLYCNRWKSLAEIGKALRAINQDKERIVLDIYTQDILTDEQSIVLSPENFIFLKGSVNQQQLRDVYKNADIALHVESLDKKFRLATRVSFSTKIIDLMASTCAILAVCWNQHTGYKYLKDNDAAFCIGDYTDLLPTLTNICNNPSLIQEYAQKAYECGKKNHTKAKIQCQLLDAFTVAIKSKSSRRGAE